MNNSFFAGARILRGHAAADVDLGPLTQLQGTWKSVSVPADQIASGWNVISVPGVESSFVFEVIPYTETLTFEPVVIAGNRGPVVNGAQVEQQITGLMYQQTIVSACPGDKPCTERGFPNGTEIHAETGFFLLLGDPNGGYSIARLSTIPHGNSLLALGYSTIEENPENTFIPAASAVPTDLRGGTHGLPLDYQDAVTRMLQFPGIFNQADPNTFLTQSLSGQTITKMTTLHLTTDTKDAQAGILNIPFIDTSITATSMDATFWIQTIRGQDALQLQYTQTINLVFPPTNVSSPVVWPHITIATLQKVS